jgi:hypothetical protein
VTAAQAMVAAAAAFLDGLGAEQRAAATFPVDDDDERRDWHYRPRERPGLAVSAMDSAQRWSAYRLLAAGVSPTAFATAAAIIALEDVLDEEEHHRRRRHALGYSVSVFGQPGDDAWGWRFEGHHLSLHHSVVGGELRSAPQFLGARPARVEVAGHPVVQPLRAEEELARALVGRLDRSEHSAAILAGEAPPDVVTGNAPEVTGWLEPRGVAGADLGADAAGALRALLEVYLGRFPAEVADHERRALGDGDVHFAWAGTTEPGGPHYYRLQSQTFLVEYDNTQDGANHAHSVWRSRAGDFGADLLRRHHQEHHGPPVA